MKFGEPRDLLVGVSGVYLQYAPGSADVVYVGMSLTCVVARSTKYAGGHWVTVIPLKKSDADVRQIERVLIAAFQPQFNKADRTTISQVTAIRWVRRHLPQLRHPLLISRRRYRQTKELMQFANDPDSVKFAENGARA